MFSRIDLRQFNRFVAALLVVQMTFSGIVFPIPKSEAASSQCAPARRATPARLQTSPRVGGVALNLAATFLANMTDVTGAYYDAQSDRIVFVGRTNTAAPQFNKDDLAVAIRAIFFKNTIPAVSIEYQDNNNPAGPGNMRALYYGGIEDTQFGKVLYEADFALKKYALGYVDNQQPLQSSVVGYKSLLTRYLEKNPTPGSNKGRSWITPKIVTLKQDSATSSFVFDQVQMQVLHEGLSSSNQPAWNQAGAEFAQFQTEHYDEFAAENPSWQQIKQLAKIVAVVKWLRDNNVTTDFEWARSYQPKYVATPRESPRYTTPTIYKNGYSWQFTGGIVYDTSNSYVSGNGVATTIKNASEAVPASNTDIHWTFTSNGTNYDAVAVSADAFRQLGGYSTNVTDMAFPLPGDLPLAFTRSYNSQSMYSMGLGMGWDIFPVHLSNPQPNRVRSCVQGDNAPAFLSFDTGNEQEEFTFTCSGYAPNMPYYHSRIIRQPDGSYLVRLTNQVQYGFDAAFNLRTIKDKNGNTLTYEYDAGNHLTSIHDASGHNLTLTYDATGMLSRLTDWTGRAVTYAYSDGNLTAVTDPRGNVTRYAYDSFGRITGITNREGQQTLQLTYTQEGKIASQKDAYGTTVNATYDLDHRTINTVDSNGRTAQMKYDERARVLEDTDAMGGKVTYGYAQELAPVNIKDQRSFNTSLTYDQSGNLLTTLLPDGNTITNAYDNANRIIKISDTRYQATPPATPSVTFSNTLGSPAYQSMNLFFQNIPAGSTIRAYDEQGRDFIGGPYAIPSPTGNVILGLLRSSAAQQMIIHFFNYAGQEVRIITLRPYTSEENGLTITLEGLIATGKTVTFTYDSRGNLLTKNESGSLTQFTYDAYGEPLTVTDSLGQKTTYTRDGLGNVLTATNPLSQRTTYSYDSLGRVLSVADAFGTTTRTTYDANGNALTSTDGINSVTTTYDRENRPAIIQQATGDKTQIAYNAANDAVQVTDGKGNMATYTYDGYGNLLTRKNAAGKEYKQDFDVLNRVKKTTTPLGIIQQFTYDAAGNVLTSTDAVGQVTSMQYDNMNRAMLTTFQDQTTLSAQYDGRGNVTQLSGGVGPTTFKRDGFDRLTQTTDPYGNTVSYAYDKNDRLISLTYPGNQKVTYAYDAADNLTSVTDWNNQVTQLTYYPNGLLQQKTFPNGITQSFTYDAANRLRQQVLKNATGVVQAQIDYERDGNGNITKLSETGPWFVQPGNGGTSSPNLTPTWPTNAGTGLPTLILQSGLPTVRFSVSPDGTQLLAIRNDGRVEIRRVVDGIITKTIETALTNAQSIEWSPDGKKFVVAAYTSANDAVVRVWSIDTSSVMWTQNFGRTGIVDAGWSADGTGVFGAPSPGPTRLFDSQSGSEKMRTGSTPNNHATALSPDGKTLYIEIRPGVTGFDTITGASKGTFGTGIGGDVSVVAPSPDGKYLVVAGAEGEVLLIDAVTRGLLSTVTGKGGYVSSVEWNGSMFAVARSLQSGVTPAVTLYTVTGNGQVTQSLQKQFPAGAGNFFQLKFAGDGKTLIVQTGSWQDNALAALAYGGGSSSSPSSAVTTFSYDVLGQLTKAAYPDGKTIEYTYDAIGNRVQQKVSTGSSITTNYSYDDDAKLLKAGSGSFTYDANGAQKTKKYGPTTSSYTFNAKQQLAQIDSTITYSYDGMGNRVAKKVNGTETRYVNDVTGLSQVLAETNAANQPQNLYVRGDGLVSLGSTAANQRLFPITDAQGNVRLLLSSTGAVVAKYAYDPFGNIRKKEGGAKTDFQFSTEQNDPESGLTFLRARYYDPTTGRFIARDPLDGSLTMPISQNPYAYTISDPVNHSDPSGKVIDTIFDVCAVGLDLYHRDWGMAAVDTGLAIVPFAPAGAGIVKRTVTKAPEVTRFIGGVTVTDKFTGKVLRGTVDVGPTLNNIEAGMKPRDIFKNTEGFLPNKPYGYYEEFVHPTPGFQGVGPQRIIKGKAGDLHYTPDHYDNFIPLNPR